MTVRICSVQKTSLSFTAGIAGRPRAQQHETRRYRSRVLQPRAEGGQSDLHGAAQEAVYEKHIWLPPRPHPEGRDNPTGT